MKYNRIENTRRNIIFGLTNKIVLMIFSFVVRTIIIYKLGLDYVGLNSLFSSILQVINLAELGFGAAIVYSMYKPIAENNKELICALLRFYRNVYKIIGLIIIAIGLVILPFLPKFISGDYPININLYVLYLLNLLNSVLSYLLFAYKQSLLIAHQRNDVENNIGTIVFSLMYVLQIITLLSTSNYYYYVAIFPIATIVINIVRKVIVDKMYPQYSCHGTIPNEIKKDMSKRVFGLTLTRLCQISRNSFDSIVISSFLGLIILGRYQNYFYIMSMVITFLQIVTSSILAGIGNSIATKTVDENYKEFKLFHFGYNWIALWSTTCLVCLYQPFMKLWVGEENMMPNYFVIIMAVYFYSLKTGDVISLYKEATGIYWEDKFRPIIESVANLVLNFILVKFFGVDGVVIATIITIVFINIPWSTHVLFRTYFKKNTSDFYSHLIRYIIQLILIVGITSLISIIIPINGILQIIVIAIICTIIPNLLFILINIKNDKLLQFMLIAKQMIKKRRR